MLSAIDRNHCPPSNGMPVRHHRNTHVRHWSRLFVVIRDAYALGRLRFLPGACTLMLIAVAVPKRIPGHAALEARPAALIEGVISCSPIIHGD
jgi:hypothetical protein